ncbi:hypothetical protein D9M69_621500 [compost metagenome]
MESYYQSLDLSRDDNLRYVLNLYRLQRLGYEGFGAGSGFLKGGQASPANQGQGVSDA